MTPLVQRHAAGVAGGKYTGSMSLASSFPEEISQARRLADFLDGESGVWTSVYRSCHPDRDLGMFSVFDPPSQRAEMLSRLEWDMHACDGHPAFMEDDHGVPRYTRHGRADDMRPVVVLSSHDGVLPKMLPQVLEEFRHFHNLKAPNHRQWDADALAPLGQTERTGSYTWCREIRLDIRSGDVLSRIRAKTVAPPPPRDRKWIQGEWADPDSPEWQFKQCYDAFRRPPASDPQTPQRRIGAVATQ